MIDAYQTSSQDRVNAALERLFVAPAPELARLYEAMRYSVMNGGKRVRPLLAYAACEALGAAAEQANGAACAVELIHAYSLVHDDLPAMDDDDLRRGQPTTHKAFDEACAILAGDGLQSLAFSTLLDPQLNASGGQLDRGSVVQVLEAALQLAKGLGDYAVDADRHRPWRANHHAPANRRGSAPRHRPHHWPVQVRGPEPGRPHRPAAGEPACHRS